MRIWNDLVVDPIESGTNGMLSTVLAAVCAIVLVMIATSVLVIMIRKKKRKKQ